MSGKTVAFAVVAFASTTADDLVVLLTFQSLNIQNKEQTLAEMNRNMWYIAFGQILSYSIIVSIALLGLLLGNFLPEKYVALIGFIPLLLGLKGYYDYFCGDDDDDGRDKEDNNGKDKGGENDDGISMATVSPLQVTSGAGATIGADDVVSRTNGDSENANEEVKVDKKGKSEKEGEEEESNFLSTMFDRFFTAIGLNPMIQKVAIAGLVVGADNIAVYISLFAKLKEFSLVVVALVIFYFLLVVYIFMAYYLVVKIPNISETIEKYAAIAIPALLIGLGIFILSESILFQL